jgi:hypothetical protein
MAGEIIWNAERDQIGMPSEIIADSRATSPGIIRNLKAGIVPQPRTTNTKIRALDPLLATVSAVRTITRLARFLPLASPSITPWLKRPAILGKSSIDRVVGK